MEPVDIQFFLKALYLRMKGSDGYGEMAGGSEVKESSSGVK
ncbi:hypothetical protein MUS_3788 [Bacillus velezensis YAU B9601-Y2]|uniref:Uncharacterized protein n=1 Tax=Bacillus amyloliquefaciens (strain Y2) TaxID=1155777 RepID=I2CAH4_BACAY|nr:hypothetical protein MUS_3788 [Bacillus velezensis YAU B9601-Y2]